MPICDLCGNDFHDTFTITQAGRQHTFDCFECAIHMLAPTCAHCGCKVIGHGVEQNDTVFCCAHCAEHQEAHA